MLTAVSVARDCGMVASRSKVIMVNATAPGGDRVPQIEWSYDTAPEKGMEQSTGDVQIQDQVGYMFEVWNFLICEKVSKRSKVMMWHAYGYAWNTKLLNFELTSRTCLGSLKGHLKEPAGYQRTSESTRTRRFSQARLWEPRREPILGFPPNFGSWRESL